MTNEQEATARARLEEGMSYRAVAELLEVEYTDVQRFAWDSECLSWQGAKRAISIALGKLPTATTSADRDELADQVAWYVEYLYRCAVGMRDRMNSAREILG